LNEEDSAAALDDWRQGDVVLGEIEFPVVSLPDEDGDLDSYTVVGAAVLSQSCDIIRDYGVRPFIQLAAVRSFNGEEMARIEAGRDVRYLFIPALKADGLAADLDLVATVDKKWLVSRERLPGCSSDLERRKLAATLARHRQRFAFPNRFNDVMKPLRRWLEDKRNKQSVAGEFVRAISEIRVATEDWADPIELQFIVILQDDIEDADRAEWARSQVPVLERKTQSDWCSGTSFRLATVDELTARDIFQTDRLDLDGLSDA